MTGRSGTAYGEGFQAGERAGRLAASDEVRQLRIDNARLRDEAFMLKDRPRSSSVTPELLPCPFCGETRISLNKPNGYHNLGSINCPACMVVMPGATNDENELIGCWNGRANTRTPALPSGEVETLSDQNRKDAEEFCKGAFGTFVTDVSQYTEIVAELMQHATDRALASSPTPQIAGDVSVLADRLELECNVRDNHPDDYCLDLTKMFRECVAALRAPTPSFARWADTIESASLAISPARSKELDALAAEVRAGGAAQQQISPEAMAWADQEIGAIEEYKKANPDWETHLKPARDLIKPARGVPEPEAYRETVRRIAAVREKRMAEMRDALERIRNFPHDKTACEQAMSQIAGEALAMSSTPQKTLGRTDREGGWNAERGLSVTSTEDK